MRVGRSEERGGKKHAHDARSVQRSPAGQIRTQSAKLSACNSLRQPCVVRDTMINRAEHHPQHQPTRCLCASGCPSCPKVLSTNRIHTRAVDDAHGERDSSSDGKSFAHDEHLRAQQLDCVTRAHATLGVECVCVYMLRVLWCVYDDNALPSPSCTS